MRWMSMVLLLGGCISTHGRQVVCTENGEEVLREIEAVLYPRNAGWTVKTGDGRTILPSKSWTCAEVSR